MEEHELYGMTLRRLRRTLGLTQKELGERCGLSASGIGMLERGLRLPSSKAQRRLCALLPSLPPRPAGSGCAPPLSKRKSSGRLPCRSHLLCFRFSPAYRRWQQAAAA